MQRIKKLHVLSKKPLRSGTPYSPIFSPRTKILLFSGLFIIIGSLFYLLNQTIQLTYFVPEVPTPAQPKPVSPITYPIPIALSIESLDILLPINQTLITNGTWTISPLGVSHLTESANPGESGPGIYYTHNTKDRFGPIRRIKKGAEITVTTRDRAEHHYTVTDMVKTDPKELTVFFKRKEEAIYLFTCDGFADLKRFIVIAEPAKNASDEAELTEEL